jgi:hypothetical protein
VGAAEPADPVVVAEPAVSVDFAPPLQAARNASITSVVRIARTLTHSGARLQIGADHRRELAAERVWIVERRLQRLLTDRECVDRTVDGVNDREGGEPRIAIELGA